MGNYQGLKKQEMNMEKIFIIRVGQLEKFQKNSKDLNLTN